MQLPARNWSGDYAPGYGVFAVLGNHDHWTDAKLIADLFRAEGIRVLINEGLRIDVQNQSFWLAGVDDTMVGLEDLPLALAGSSDGELKLLLAHNPIILRRAARADIDLVLSGHTHGGQVTLRPEKNRSGRPRRRMLRGLGRRANTQIYVTRGLGTVVLPIRYGCLPEVSVLELRSASQYDHFDSRCSRPKSTSEIENRINVLSDYHSAERADRLSDGADSGFCLAAVLSKISAGVGSIRDCRNHRRSRRFAGAPLPPAIAARPHP